eukprot:12168134-Alexandrium_andersonii.AAC.1
MLFSASVVAALRSEMRRKHLAPLPAQPPNRRRTFNASREFTRTTAAHSNRIHFRERSTRAT